MSATEEASMSMKPSVMTSETISPDGVPSGVSKLWPPQVLPSAMI